MGSDAMKACLMTSRLTLRAIGLLFQAIGLHFARCTLHKEKGYLVAANIQLGIKETGKNNL